MSFDNSNSSINMFDLRYQLRLHDLYDFTSVSYVSYEITMQHITTLNMLFSGYPQHRFNRVQNKVFLDIDWSRDVKVGEYIVIECYRKMSPDNFTIEGTANVSNSTIVVTGVNTVFTRDLVIGDEVTFGTESKRIITITDDYTLNVDSVFSTNSNAVSVVKTGLSDVWDNRFLKRYATALIKKQWGDNLKKFGGIQMPGGVTLNGKEIWDEAVEEINKLEEELMNLNVLPGDMFIG